jgi:effector-binding domain-containing protein
VSFVMPDDVTIDTVPSPRNSDVVIREVPEEYAAVARFSGRWSSSTYRLQVTRLLRAVSEAGLEVTGAVRFARFDPPWMPWFRRRNEVVVPVRYA